MRRAAFVQFRKAFLQLSCSYSELLNFQEGSFCKNPFTQIEKHSTLDVW